MRVFAAETDTEPVPAADREDTCRGSWARLELCQPHHFHRAVENDITSGVTPTTFGPKQVCNHKIFFKGRESLLTRWPGMI